MAYIPPHLRAKPPSPAADGSTSTPPRSSLASLLDQQARTRHGPCAPAPTQMSLRRECRCTLGGLPPASSLLGTADELCDAFFHVRATPEAGLPLSCVRQPAGECEGRNTVIVAALHAAGDTPFVARYHNEGREYHAERVMIEHAGLLAAVRAARGGCLRVHISLQPCHHSSASRDISCTRALFAFHERELLPRGVALELVVAYPYRSHWDAEHMTRAELIELGARTLFGPRYHSNGNATDREAVVAAVERIGPDAADRAVEAARQLMESAREGTALLCRGAPHLFSVRAMGPEDWEWLVSLADGEVQAAWRDVADERWFTPERRKIRFAADAWTAALLDLYRCQSVEDQEPMEFNQEKDSKPAGEARDGAECVCASVSSNKGASLRAGSR
ncbi:hypothetical protein AB1Y20_023331 [Prymnesium parvum]|uniref:APOBEC-like N-terminal domain-containing protein n=1 Tax=Prymnesium parvum TaxID=97485 RepID=A0AB34JCV8_PRYPA